jgi:hypothetical protein
MKPFDLEKALASPEKVVYRNGEVPLEWHYFEKKKSVYRVLTIDKDGNERMNMITGEANNGGRVSTHDLFLKEPEMFVNRYENDEKTSQIYNSISEAKKHSFHNCKTYRLVEVTDK